MKSGEGRRILHASDHVSFTTIPTHQNRTIHIRQCIHNIALRCVSVTNDDHSGRQPRRALIATGTLPFIIIPRLTAIQWLTTNNKNDLLESSDSDSVSDLCRTFLQEVFDTLITFPNWNTTTTYRWLLIVVVASEMSRFCCCYLLVLLADMRNCSTIILSSVCQLDWEPFLPSCWSSLRTGLYCWLRELPKNVQDQGMLNYYNEEAVKATEESKAMTSCNRRQDEMH